MSIDNKSVCPFCLEIVKNRCFFSNNQYFAIYNRAPIISGHSLVIPHKHYEKLSNIPFEESKQLFPFVQQVMTILSEFFKAQSFDISIQDGTEAGQTVPHSHIHVIPRFADDYLQESGWFQVLQEHKQNSLLDSSLRQCISEEKLEEITKKLKAIAQNLFLIPVNIEQYV